MTELEQRLEGLRAVRARVTRKATGESDRTETAADVAQRDGLILALDLAEKGLVAGAQRDTEAWWFRVSLCVLALASMGAVCVSIASVALLATVLGALHG